MSKSQWQQHIGDLCTSSKIITFSDLIGLCANSPDLRRAFVEGPDASYDGFKQMLIESTFDDHRRWASDKGENCVWMEVYVDISETRREYYDALLFVADELIAKGSPLAPSHREWTRAVLRGEMKMPRNPSGSERYRIEQRDISIISFFYDMQKLGVKITENEATFENVSVCHAIAETFHGFADVPSEKTLMNIWSQRRSRAF